MKILHLFETLKLQEFLYKIYKIKIEVNNPIEGYQKEAKNSIVIKNKRKGKNLKIK